MLDLALLSAHPAIAETMLVGAAVLIAVAATLVILGSIRVPELSVGVHGVRVVRSGVFERR